MKKAFLVVLLLAAIGFSQVAFDQSSTQFRQQERSIAQSFREPLIPSLPLLRLLSFGNPSVAADVLWLQTIQYFGGSNPYGKYASLGPLLDTITQLDPRFEYPYEFGLVILPFMEGTDTAITLGERAQTVDSLKNNGLLTYYLATDYHLNKRDYKKAAFYYQKAASQPGAPSASRELAGVTLSKVQESLQDRVVAIYFWQTVAEQAKNQDEKDRAQKWQQHMTLVYEIEKDALDFKQKNNRFPRDVAELVQSGYFPTLPVSPTGRALDLNPQTGKVSFERLLNP